MKKMLLVLLALIVAFTPLFAAGQQEKKDENVTLNVLFYSPELAEQYNDMVAEYKKATGVTLDITVLQTDYRSVLTSRLNSGDVPDIFMSSAYADNSTYKDYVYDLTNEDFIKQIEPGALQGVISDGKVTGYPFLVQSHSFIYNKKVFRDNGITTLPKTLSEFEAVAKKLQANGVQPFATGFKEFWVLPQTAWQAIANVPTDNYGGYEKFVGMLNSGALKFKDIPQMSQLFDLLDLIKKYGGPKPNESDFNDQTSALATGKVAMIHQGNWAEDSIRKTNPEVEIGLLVGPTETTQQPPVLCSTPTRPSALPRTARIVRPPRLAEMAHHQRIRQELDSRQGKAALSDHRCRCSRLPYRQRDISPACKRDSRLSLVLPDVPHRNRAAAWCNPAGLLRRSHRS